MKKQFLLFTFILAMITGVAAQDKAFNFGFKIAPAISWLGIDEKGVSSDGAKVKFDWGVIVAYNFTENFSLVSGLNINSLGGKVKIDAGNIKGEGKYTEIQLPAIFQMKTNEIGDFKLYAQFGLGEGVIVNAKDGNGNSISGDTRNFNTSYIVAGGIEYGVTGGVDLIGQIKFNGGLTSINKKDVGYKARTNFVELGFGVMF